MSSDHIWSNRKTIKILNALLYHKKKIRSIVYNSIYFFDLTNKSYINSKFRRNSTRVTLQTNAAVCERTWLANIMRKCFDKSYSHWKSPAQNEKWSSKNKSDTYEQYKKNIKVILKRVEKCQKWIWKSCDASSGAPTWRGPSRTLGFSSCWKPKDRRLLTLVVSTTNTRIYPTTRSGLSSLRLGWSRRLTRIKTGIAIVWFFFVWIFSCVTFFGVNFRLWLRF